MAHIHNPFSLQTPGPYNPGASLPPKVVKKILDLEFVMSDLKSRHLGGGAPTFRHRPHTPNKPPVTDIKVWLECFAFAWQLCLVTRFPEKGPELWTCQTSILRAAHNYEGSNWVAYDRQFQQDILSPQGPELVHPICSALQ